MGILRACGCLPTDWEVLGWPKSSLWFFHEMLQKNLNNFLDNPICHYCNNWYHCDIHTAAAAKSRPSCPTLCNPIDGSPPGSSIPGILQARILEASTLNRKTVEFYFPLKLGNRKFQASDHIRLRQKPCQDSVWALLDSRKSAHLPDVLFP